MNLAIRLHCGDLRRILFRRTVGFLTLDAVSAAAGPREAMVFEAQPEAEFVYRLGFRPASNYSW